MGVEVYTHAHALTQPDQCSSVIGGASGRGRHFRASGLGKMEPDAEACGNAHACAAQTGSMLIGRWSSFAGILQRWLQPGVLKPWQWTMPPWSPKCLAL